MLNRETRFATFAILNSVELGVNPVFCCLKASLCKPAHCPKGQGYQACAVGMVQLPMPRFRRLPSVPEIYCPPRVDWSVRIGR